MSSASFAVTYTSVYTDSESKRVFWGADEELSNGEPMYPKYIPLEDEHVFLAEEQPLPPVVSPTAESPEYVAELDPEEDPKEYEDDETEDGPVDYLMDRGDNGDDDHSDSFGDDADNEGEDEEEEEEEEEHLAPADFVVVIPTDELVYPPEGIEHVMPPPSTDTTTTGTRITVRLQTAISFPPEAEVERLLAMPTLPPSPLALLSPPSARERLARCTTLAALPSPTLPPPLHMPPPVDRRDDIPETEMLPRKRLYFSTLGSRDSEWVDLLMEDSIAYQETIEIVEEEAYVAQEAWAHSIRLSQAVYSKLQTHREQAELLALREQQRRARQPGGDARVPNHQDAPRDADSHI
uniref:Uncharacterized protein n=1 Tax=Tanacetum cinerariifolium TaxID=118510 RepID=A0A6L2LL22_TANCI|nr:hypothetical protein [Tanacetum cinerariifolium]